jgi:hypothetical protein
MRQNERNYHRQPTDHRCHISPSAIARTRYQPNRDVLASFSIGNPLDEQ